MKKPVLNIALWGTLALSVPTMAQVAPSDSTQVEEVVDDSDFLDFSLEDLMNVEITSVSKKAERLQDVSSSIYVLTSADIANSGATTLHEALRNVPGYWGVQDEYNSVAPLVRNSPSENGSVGTVLYLLDGTPIQDNMSSVFNMRNFDIPLDEIDRIEIIRGSGGTVYGANSATGVVNIFTKNPEKYDGINAKGEYAAPGFVNVTVRAGGKINDKLAVSGYGRVRSFSGFGDHGFEGDSLTVQKSDGSGTTRIKNAFTSDFESSQAYSAGLKAVYNISDKTKLSFNNHFNLGTQTQYTNFDTDLALLGFITGTTIADSVIENDVTRSRIVSHLKLDHNFNDNHSLFVRTSTNIENDFLKILGGYKVNNSIYDFEIQDNLSIGKMHDLSVGANFRTVNFDVNGVNDQVGLAYIDPKASENLTGFFAQDKVKFMDGKVNLIVGMKAENYSLINDNYYLSPMAKLAVIPNENITVWGGFTQSYTTPGYNNTNIDLFLFKKADASAQPLIQQFAEDEVYQGVYDQAIAGGAPAAIADAQATSFVNSFPGQLAVQGAADGISSALTNQGVINGSETVPTKYQTWEVGVRASNGSQISLESNFYYSTITDAISASNDVILPATASPARPGIIGDYFLYGNYIKGTTYGTESIIKWIPKKGTVIEVSHVFTKAEWEFQENGDFDINDPAVIAPEDIDRTPDNPKVPEHVIRVRGTFQLPKDFRVSLGMIAATKFGTQANYEFDNQRHPSILTGSTTGQVVAEDDSRMIFNLKVEKTMLDDKLNVYFFANDFLNEGIIASTTVLSNVTLSKIGGMFGLGANYKF